MASEEGDEGQWDMKFREDEELEFFTELALHEVERWITAVTKKCFAYPDDTRKSLENGILLCELLNNIKPGSVKRINKLPTPIAGLDNLHVFLRACREHFELNDTHLFDPSDLEDLSQRAIAESEHLKEELDRRLRNVAITVYWIGRVASQSYQGPKIDQSAFSALVHNQHRHREHIVSDGQLRRDSSCSWDNYSPSNAYGTHEGRNSLGSVKEAIDPGYRHARDGSYDSYASYEKGSEDSLDESVFEVDENGMPIPRYSSSSALNSSRDRAGRGGDQESSMYSSKNSGVYQSSPDLSHGTISNRRSSSMDSTDGSSYHGGHSRQSSDSVEYPTRRLSTQMPQRKSSVSADPLQFIKVKGATDLAVTAEEQMKLAAETKKLKITESISEVADDNTDWQSNLASWKNRRKSHSEKSYQLKEELEQMEREKEEPREKSSTTTKTFSQMQEERERRKSAGTKHFYPIDDEGDDDIFTPASSEQQYSSPPSRSSSRFQSAVTSKEDGKDTKFSSRTKDNVAAWARDSASEEEEEEEKEEKTRSSNLNSKPEPRTSRFSRDDDTSNTYQRRSGAPGYQATESRDTRQKSRADTGRESAFKENNRNSANNSSTSSSKSANKISNILKSFEQKEETGAKPRGNVNSSIDVSARKKSFENFGARSVDVDSYRSWSTDHRDEKPTRGRGRSEVTSNTSSSVYSSNRSSGKDYVEKTIKISQKPNNVKGFGFTLSGGADKKQPVVVEKIGLGSAADICELQTKDEVMSINGQSVTRLTSVELNQKVQDAVRTGQIELRVKRFLGSGDDFEDEEDFLSTDEELDTPDRSVSKSSSIHAENSFDSLDSRDGPQKVEVETDRQWIEEPAASITTQIGTRRGDPTSTSSDSGYDAQTFSPYHRGDNSSNEEEIAPVLQQQPVEQKRPSLAARTKHLYHHDDDDEDDYVNLKVTDTNQNTLKTDYSEKVPQREIVQTQQIEVESRPSITVRRERVEVSEKRAEKEDDSKPLASYEAQIEVSARRENEKDREQNSGNDSDSGPPAALRKWQRQRPRAEYTFESDDTPPKFYDQLKFSSSQSQRMESAPSDYHQEESAAHKLGDTDDTAQTQPPFVSSHRSFNIREDRRRMLDWNKQQEDERQPADQLPSGHSENPIEISLPYEQQRFTVEREQIQHQYQADLQRAKDAERQKQDQERQLLEPELEKMRLLEERRAQRQARLQMYSQDLSADFAPPTTSSSIRSSAPQYSEPAYGGNEQQHTSTFTTQIQGGKTNASQPEVLIIDPRNRGTGGEPVEISQPGQPLQFQLKINSRETPQGLLIQPEVIPTQHSVPSRQDHAAFLEAERERIRQEELQKIEMERRQKEEEERQQLRSKEEQLRQQEENLRRQQEELRKTQERLEQERQQLQQQQQHMVPPQSQQSDFSQDSSHDSLMFETVTSKVRGGSPAYTSTIVAGPRRSDARPQASGSYAERNRDVGSYADRNQDGYGVRRSEPSWNNPGSQNSSWRGNSHAVSSSQNSLPKWPPAGGEQGREGNMSSQGAGAGQYSREDMLAMNRKPTPLQARPPSQSPNSPPADHPEVASPVKREAPSKGQLHSLNSVPKAKFRNADQWIADDPSQYPDRSGNSGESRPPPVVPRRSEQYRNQFTGPQDHWLVQEAERRRLNESGYNQGPSRTQFSGPIKPATDSYGNRWSEKGSEVRLSPNMPAQIRQTLLQKTAEARGSTASNSSQEMNPRLPGPNYHSNSPSSLSQTLPPNYSYGSNYPQRSRSDVLPPQHRAPSPDEGREGGTNVSGKQRCSHCNQELGFGAAMVIESLGLYYHTQCFKCCVCRAPLGNGVEGADVRVRVNKLHCPNCYSNDEAGLKFSKV